MAQATSPDSAARASCPIRSANWHAPWVCGWPLSPTACRAAREHRSHHAFAHPVVLACHRPEPARLDDGRASLGPVRARRTAVARAAQSPQTRPPPYLRVGHLIRRSLSGLCVDGIAGQLRRTLGRLADPAAGIRMVLHYDFVL